MKLAEALILRADCTKKLSQLMKRIENNAKVQEGETPNENPLVLIEEFKRKNDELTELVKRINKTNIETKFDDENTLTDILATRDSIVNKLNMLNRLVKAATVKQDIYTRSEVKFIRTIEIDKIQKQIDILSKNYREIDTKIQALNWNIDLI